MRLGLGLARRVSVMQVHHVQCSKGIPRHKFFLLNPCQRLIKSSAYINWGNSANSRSWLLHSPCFSILISASSGVGLWLNRTYSPGCHSHGASYQTCHSLLVGYLLWEHQQRATPRQGLLPRWFHHSHQEQQREASRCDLLCGNPLQCVVSIKCPFWPTS